MDIAYVNRVELVGRVSHAGEERVLPSGDRLHAWRLVVPRAGGRSRVGGRGQVDVVDVTCWSAATRRVAGRLAEGDVVEVSGALRRRFFRGPTGLGSRYEVEAVTMRRVGTVAPSGHD
jgi:single-strand DNA-binding protein